MLKFFTKKKTSPPAPPPPPPAVVDSAIDSAIDSATLARRTRRYLLSKKYVKIWLTNSGLVSSLEASRQTSRPYAKALKVTTKTPITLDEYKVSNDACSLSVKSISKLSLTLFFLFFFFESAPLLPKASPPTRAKIKQKSTQTTPRLQLPRLPPPLRRFHKTLQPQNLKEALPH